MFGNAMASFNIHSISVIITVQSDGDGDDDGNITVSDERLSFDLKNDDDDDVNRY